MTLFGEVEPHVRVGEDGSVELVVGVGVASEELVGAMLRLVTNRTQPLRLAEVTRGRQAFEFRFVGGPGAGR